MIKCELCGGLVARERGVNDYVGLQRQAYFIHMIGYHHSCVVDEIGNVTTEHGHSVDPVIARQKAETVEILSAVGVPREFEVRWEPSRDAWRRGKSEEFIADFMNISKKAFRTRRRKWWKEYGWFEPRKRS
jgi:hypothetical protein